jgi:exonuclease III
MKRPRNNSKDGCAILYRKTKLKLLDSSGFAYNDDMEGNRKDRVALMGLFQMHHVMDGEDDRVIFVSTHLARNPEDEKQNEIRIRQVSELMIELRMFANTHDALNVPVIVAGDWNAETIETLRFMSLALFSLQHIFQDAHPMLLGGIDIVTAKTAFTMQRQSRIDYLLYQDNLLRPVSQQIYPAESDLPSQKCIPNEEHPSDHLPVWADFEIASRLQVARECAQAYAPPTASTSRLTKCIHTHLTRPLNRPMHE